MTTNNRLQRLSRLRADANRSLRSFSMRTSRMPRDSASQQAEVASGGVNVNVNLVGEVFFLDDERRMRALAKEIKRLITEDRRRGLGVGG